MGLLKNLFHNFAYKRAEKEFLEEVKNAQIQDDTLSVQPTLVNANETEDQAMFQPDGASVPVIEPVEKNRVENVQNDSLLLKTSPRVESSAESEQSKSHQQAGESEFKDKPSFVSITQNKPSSDVSAVQNKKTENGESVIDPREAHKKWLQEWLAKRSAVENEDEDEEGEGEK